MILGMMAMKASELQDEGKSLEEVVNYINENMQRYNLCGTVGTLTYLRRAGRVSGASAFFGNLFGVKPVIIADTLGHNYALSKIKGIKNAYAAIFDLLKGIVEGQEHPLIYIGQGMSSFTINFIKLFRELMDDASNLIKEKCPKIYSHELVEYLFYDFYTKNEYLRNALDISRNTASKYLNELEEAGVLISEMVGKEKIFKNAYLYSLIEKW